MIPVGQPPEDDESPPEEASFVDPKVLAERRARRAEIAEESLLSRVNRAEQDRVVLATRLAEAEQEIAVARRDRETLARDLDRRERELRAAEQREFAEQQRRVEAEDEAVQTQRATRGDVDALRRQVQAAEQRIDELGRELEVARREAAEAARTAAQERARAERRSTGGGERRAILAEQEKDLRRRVAEVERLEQQAREVSAKLDQRRDSLEAEIIALQTFADELDGTLRAERDRRAALESELAAERERASAEITLLQHELDRRTRERDEAATERNRLATSLESVRSQLLIARETIAQRDRLIAEAEQVRATTAGLQARLTEEQSAWRGREEELQRQMEAERRQVANEILERESALRAEFELQRRDFDRQVSELEAAAAGLRAQAAGAADELEMRVSAERAVKEAAIAALEKEKARLGEQRSFSMQEVAAERERLAEQRREHEAAAARERRELETARREAAELAHRARSDADRTVEDEMRRAADELAAVREDALAARREAADATAAREALQEELRRRVELEDQVREAIGELRGRLQDADAQEAARAERDAAVEALVAELVETASTLRSGFEQELAETERRLRGQVDDERTRFAEELTAMEERIGTLRSQLGGAADELREQLEAERTARWNAETELAAERERGRDDRVAATDAARVQADLERELTARMLSESAAQEALEAVQRELEQLRGAQADVAAAGLFAATGPAIEEDAGDEEPEPVATPAARFDVTGLDPETASLIGDLQAAADRLRAQVAAAEADVAGAAEVVQELPVETEPAHPPAVAYEPEPAYEPTPEPIHGADPTSESEPAHAPALGPEAAYGPEPTHDPEVAFVPEPPALEPVAVPEPAFTAAPAPWTAEPQGDPGGVQVLAARAADGPADQWLAPALTRAATTDPASVARMLPSVLRTHGRRSTKDVSYDLVTEDLGIWHVRVAGGLATVDSREGGTGGDVDFALRGPLASLIAFAVGGTGRRPGDVSVSGRKRRFRRLLKDLRQPIGLADVSAAGAVVAPDDLLRLLAGQVDTTDLYGHLMTVQYDVSGPSGGRWHVAVDGDVRVHDGAAPNGATGTVEVADRALLALLTGGSPPPGERALVHGSTNAVDLLHRWFDQAQGLRR